MPSPPKPWEVNNDNTPVVTSPTAAASLSAVPDVPTRTDTTTATSGLANATSGFGSTGYGSTGYGGYGGMNSMNRYGSSYGGYGSSYGGYGSSYGGYGSSYGGYGSSYGGYGGYGNSYGGYGGGMNRFGGGPMGPGDMSLTQKMEMGTRSTFQVIENIVGSFGGFAHMLDSTFMATHSSFMAMVGVAEQLGYLKNYLGQVFSVFALYRFARKMVDKVTGKARPLEMNLSEFEKFGQNTTPTMSKKPLVIFLLIVVGLPYLMHKLIKMISAKQQQLMPQQQQQQNPLAGVDPSKLEFARAMYDFKAESPNELNLKKGDIVAIITKVDSQWWRGRTRDGTMGMFPANYVEIIQKGGPPASNEVKKVLEEAKEEAAAVVPATIQ